ncbi:MAG: ComF family protein [Patescibacteria group bacterium]
MFPIQCISCNKPGIWLCDDCLNKIILKETQFCPYCEKKITPSGYVCFECKKKYSLDGMLVAVSYQNKLVSHLIHLYKYRFISGLHEPLGELLLRSILKYEFPLPDAIIPVPLHKRRLRYRGFNQSELLADYLGKNITPGFSIPILKEVLTRKKYTHPQMKIKDSGARKKNIAEAFAVPRNMLKYIKSKRILLVDDISTTGATIFECAKTLKKSGASEVFAIVIARQGYK